MSILGALRQVVAYLVLLVVTFVICFPLIWALSTSLKAQKDVMDTPPQLLPRQPTLENYRNLVTGKQQYFRADQSYVPTTAAPQHFTSWFANSVVVSLGSTANSR